MPRWVEQRVRETERFGGAPCLRHADAPHGDPRRGGARDSSVLYRGRRSAARTCCPAGARNLVRVLAHSPPRLAARRVCASDYGLGPIPFQKRTRPPRRYLLNGKLSSRSVSREDASAPNSADSGCWLGMARGSGRGSKHSNVGRPGNDVVSSRGMPGLGHNPPLLNEPSAPLWVETRPPNRVSKVRFSP